MSPKAPSKSQAPKSQAPKSQAPKSQAPLPGEPSEGPVGSKPRGDRPAELAPGLHIVATPIGHLDDITLRALTTLAGAAVIACEDQRVTRKLLRAHGIEARLVSYHDHNAARIRPRLIERIRGGQAVALVSDAGTPLISDPGLKLVQAVLAESLAVTFVPGASAPLAALALSGLPSDRFFFVGFLPPRRAARRRELATLSAIEASLLFFESARRLPDSLADMASVLGRRQAAVARELTKLFEEVRRGELAELAAHYGEAGPPKGEVVVVVGPPLAGEPPDENELDALLRRALDGASLRDAVDRVASETGLPRRRVYDSALALKKSAGAPDS